MLCVSVVIQRFIVTFIDATAPLKKRHKTYGCVHCAIRSIDHRRWSETEFHRWDHIKKHLGDPQFGLLNIIIKTQQFWLLFF